jgi:hypothetical protein
MTGVFHVHIKRRTGLHLPAHSSMAASTSPGQQRPADDEWPVRPDPSAPSAPSGVAVAMWATADRADSSAVRSSAAPPPDASRCGVSATAACASAPGNALGIAFSGGSSASIVASPVRPRPLRLLRLRGASRHYAATERAVCGARVLAGELHPRRARARHRRRNRSRAVRGLLAELRILAAFGAFRNSPAAAMTPGQRQSPHDLVIRPARRQ